MSKKVFRKIVCLMLLSVIVGLLTACDSEEEVDQKVRDYISSAYGFDIDIVYRESINEGNMGERAYLVMNKEEPQVEFMVYLEGMMSTAVVGDNYKVQAEAKAHGDQFAENYKQQLSNLKFTDLLFTHSSNGIEVDIVYNQPISVFNDESIKPLWELIGLFKAFRSEEGLKDQFDSLSIYYTSEERIYLEEFEEIRSFDELKSTLVQDVVLVNNSIFDKDKTLFIDLENDLKRLGFEYYYGFPNNNSLHSSVFCYADELENTDCVGGYSLVLRGESVDNEKLFDLITFLNNHSSLVFKGLTVDKNDEKIFIEDVKKIKDRQQLEGNSEI